MQRDKHMSTQDADAHTFYFHLPWRVQKAAITIEQNTIIKTVISKGEYKLKDKVACMCIDHFYHL